VVDLDRFGLSTYLLTAGVMSKKTVTKVKGIKDF
jgi:hypothetical protein